LFLRKIIIAFCDVNVLLGIGLYSGLINKGDTEMKNPYNAFGKKVYVTSEKPLSYAQRLAYAFAPARTGKGLAGRKDGNYGMALVAIMRARMAD
jgi:hypothetical protein